MTAPATHQGVMTGLEVVLVGTRFPENVGMAVRACANMGCDRLTLVDPERWEPEKARPLATSKGEDLLGRVRVTASLEEALAESALVIGTTARTGGWRRELLLPEEAAEAALPLLQERARVAIVFGREDRGLTNDELEHCHRLVTIPTAEASSLNLAQAVLLLLYAFQRAFVPDAGGRRLGDPGALSRRVTHAERELVYTTVRTTLLEIDYLHPENPDYFLMPVRRFLGKAELRRHEMDMLMGICRQIRSLRAHGARTGKDGDRPE